MLRWLLHICAHDQLRRPRWFKREGDVRHTLMSFGFCHGDGWFDILWRLCEDLEPLVAEFEAAGHQFEVLLLKYC